MKRETDACDLAPGRTAARRGRRVVGGELLHQHVERDRALGIGDRDHRHRRIGQLGQVVERLQRALLAAQRADGRVKGALGLERGAPFVRRHAEVLGDQRVADLGDRGAVGAVAPASKATSHSVSRPIERLEKLAEPTRSHWSSTTAILECTSTQVPSFRPATCGA